MDRESLSKLAQPIVDIYNQIELELLLNIAKRLKDKKVELETDANAWRLQMLHNLGLLDEENLKIIRKHAKLTSAQLNKMLYKAGLMGLKDMEEMIKRAIKKGAKLKTPPPVGKSPTILAILEAYSKQARNVLNLANMTLIDKAKQAYIDIINKVVVDTLTGYYTGEQSIRKALMEWGQKGIPALVDRAGRNWGPEGYVRTVMVSTYGNTVNAMQDARMEEYGIDLIEVSSHAGARPKCAPYQGKIYSLKPGHPKYPYIGTTSIGEPDGLFGINCGHSKYPYIEGVSRKTYHPYPKKENDRIYQESQQQRAIERAIRKAKTKELMLKEAGDIEGAKKAHEQVLKYQAQMREFIEKTGRTRRRYREQIVR